MSTELRGGCHCGALTLDVALSQAASQYTPRACDCAFCRRHGASWLSDAQGRLSLHARDATSVTRYRQGSEQAEFVACAHCAVLVAVVCEADGHRYAAVNARALDPDRVAGFAPEQVASPQQLPAADKLARWRQLWFADVRFDVG